MNYKRKKPSQHRSIQTVQSILDTARFILKSDGPLKFSTNLIAKKSGLSVGSIYQYFQSKEKIIEILIEKEIHKALNQFEKNVSSLIELGIEEKVNRLIQQISKLMIDNDYLIQAHRLFDLSEHVNLNQSFHQKISRISIPVLLDKKMNINKKNIEECLMIVRETLFSTEDFSHRQTIPVLSTVLISVLNQPI